MYNPNTLGKFLRLKRKGRQLTILAVAVETGLSVSNISHIETGKFHSPSQYNLEKFGNFYDVAVLELAKMIDVPSHKIKDYIKAYE